MACGSSPRCHFEGLEWKEKRKKSRTGSARSEYTRDVLLAAVSASTRDQWRVRNRSNAHDTMHEASYSSMKDFIVSPLVIHRRTSSPAKDRWSRDQRSIPGAKSSANDRSSDGGTYLQSGESVIEAGTRTTWRDEFPRDRNRDRRGNGTLSRWSCDNTRSDDAARAEEGHG